MHRLLVCRTSPLRTLNLNENVNQKIAANRIRIAREAMNDAPTRELTHYWYRIWKARLRILGFNELKKTYPTRAPKP